MSDHHDRQQEQESSHPRHPLWKRAHLDWRFWAVVILMLAAIGMYVASENESLRFGKRSYTPQPNVNRN